MVKMNCMLACLTVVAIDDRKEPHRSVTLLEIEALEVVPRHGEEHHDKREPGDAGQKSFDETIEHGCRP